MGSWNFRQEYNQLGETSMREEQLLNRTQTLVGLVNIAVHGHFYQPPREDPFTGIIPEELGATPFRNFNEKITAECYRPNAEAGNFDVMSFNLGPTLACWLEKAHPEVYRRIIEADRFHHNALAQGYTHIILPLASERDKRTQILWGMQDFRHRFGREPRGMWMAETAVDIETLD
ncbi:MAG: glycoside hydrolase, partial [Acidobacteria bacterium]